MKGRETSGKPLDVTHGAQDLKRIFTSLIYGTVAKLSYLKHVCDTVVTVEN